MKENLPPAAGHFLVSWAAKGMRPLSTAVPIIKHQLIFSSGGIFSQSWNKSRWADYGADG